jgi:hypothetical protein
MVLMSHYKENPADLTTDDIESISTAFAILKQQDAVQDYLYEQGV